MTTAPEHVQRWRTNHHKALEALATQDGFNPQSGLNLWRKLHRLETEVHSATTAQCNGEAYQGQPYRNEQEWELYLQHVEYRVRAILGTLPKGFLVNDDPHGYALKIESDALPEGMHRDWGGYGILAPEIND